MRDCHKWVAAIGKYVWQIAQKEDLLWIKWVHHVYIRDQDWWEYKPPPTASWLWRLICKVKEDLKPAYTNNRWLDGGKDYSAKEGYKWLTAQREQVNWHHLVWNVADKPKHSFISWLVALDKLRTRVQLAKANIY